MKKMNFKVTRNLLFIFELISLSLIFLYNWPNFDKNTIYLSLGLIVLVYVSNILLFKLSKGDHYIFLIICMLMSIGVIMIYRIDQNLGLKQLIWLYVGIISFFITYLIFKLYDNWSKHFNLYLISSYILFFATLVYGFRTHGSIRWLSIGGISFQPSELIKIILVFILACIYSDRTYLSSPRISKYKEIITMAIVYSFIAILFVQRNLGASLVFFAIFIGIQYIYTENSKYTLLNLMLFAFGGTMGYFLFDHVKIRFLTWLDPWKYIDTIGYQITQSLFAISEGGFFGTGIGRGQPNFIPLAYNDFIFSAIIEEMGIFTGIAIIMLYLIFVYRGFKIALKQNDVFYRIISIGISLLFGIQTFIIIGGVIKLIPLTGLTLPFISYGGTSILTSFIALGILQGTSEKYNHGGPSDE
ncbi:FtsW/RodA/SpoVE family cell cycle protein [Soehngenia saccharolytica]|nr:FtsW/RodA/SpoVE family cell cycle protein [Soehngenia saccharolytica]